MDDERGAYSWGCIRCKESLYSQPGETFVKFLIRTWDAHILEHLEDGFSQRQVWAGFGSFVVPTIAAVASPGFAALPSMAEAGLLMVWPATFERERE